MTAATTILLLCFQSTLESLSSLTLPHRELLGIVAADVFGRLDAFHVSLLAVSNSATTTKLCLRKTCQLWRGVVSTCTD